MAFEVEWSLVCVGGILCQRVGVIIAANTVSFAGDAASQPRITATLWKPRW